jgi:N-acetylglucosamine-6-phosphate deacetylase
MLQFSVCQEEALRNDSLTVSVIADFVHVHPHLLRDWIARKEIPRIIAVTDCAFATGLQLRKSFEVFGQSGAVSDDGTYLVAQTSGCDAGKDRTTEKNSKISDGPTLFGSCATMKQVFENILNLMCHEMKSVYTRQHEAMSLHDAIRTAVAICSSNPACLLGIDHLCGTVQPGMEATLLLVKISEEAVCSHKKWHSCDWQKYVTVTLKKVIYRGNLLDAA